MSYIVVLARFADCVYRNPVLRIDSFLDIYNVNCGIVAEEGK